MDPNANLQEQERILLAGVERGRQAYPQNRVSVEARADQDRLQELRDALSGWMARGGFAPDWRACPNAAQYFGK